MTNRPHTCLVLCVPHCRPCESGLLLLSPVVIPAIIPDSLTSQQECPSLQEAIHDCCLLCPPVFSPHTPTTPSRLPPHTLLKNSQQPVICSVAAHSVWTPGGQRGPSVHYVLSPSTAPGEKGPGTHSGWVNASGFLSVHLFSPHPLPMNVL